MQVELCPSPCENDLREDMCSESWPSQQVTVVMSFPPASCLLPPFAPEAEYACPLRDLDHIWGRTLVIRPGADPSVKS